ncbi:MAG TPA: hypothetical protein VM656_03510 [Pyrinomonadaceae bacterium]|nr:hypothetical protein [Pyrinomonadaceae bacterium]
MSIDRAAQARRISIKYARLAKRPLEVWPGDEAEIGIEDLPEVGSEWKQTYTGVKTFTAGEFANYASKMLIPGLRYGIISKAFIQGVGVEYVVGMWR